MHKSKGLQYDYVIIPQLGGQGANDEKALITLHERLNTQNELRLLIAAVKRKGEQPTPESRANETLYDYIQGENKQKDLFEQTRLVYIAMTRAKRSVSLFATLNQKEKDDGELTQLKPNSRSLLARIWEPLQAAGIEGEIVITPTSTTQAENPDELPRVTPIKRLKRPLALAQDRAEILQAQFDSTTTAADTLIDGAAELQRRLSQQLGTLSHAFLEAYCLKPFDMTAALSAVIPRWQRQLQRQGASAALAKSLCARASEDLIHCLKGEHAWLFASQDDAATELKLASSERRGNEEYHAHSVVDRTLVKDGVRWIIDFKTSQQTEGQSREEFIAAQSLEYQPQLDRYAALFKGFESLPQQRALFLVSINELVCL
jgi:ATP-dependent helicase/nuclease subunit A